jgi:superfamily I DNA/RNA helicase
MSKTRTWSKYQSAIFNFIENCTGNAIVEAVAGSGKSTTIVEGMSRLPSNLKSVFLAFNKAIATELKERGVDARTFHSLTYMPVMNFKKAKKVEMNKMYLLTDDIFTGEENRMYGSFIRKLVGLAKQSGIGCLVPNTEAQWMAIIEHHDMELDDDEADLVTAILMAQKLLRASNESPMVDFDDMLYLSVKEGLTLPKFDFIFVDEAQDTNAIQRAILRKILKPSTRLIAVGDPSQAIYGFRGADSDSLDLIAKEFNCIKLPLTVSYRCPTSVVEHAHRWVQNIEAAPDASEGSVTHLSNRWKTSMFKANDLVVCRTTAPLIALAYRMMVDKVPFYVMGRDIGQGLNTLIDQMKAKNIEFLVQKLEKWSVREVEKAIAKKNEAKADAIRDKANAITRLVESMPESKRTIPELQRTISSLFENRADATILATIHKSKGLESDNVYWLNSSQCPSKWAKTPWQIRQEHNLCYVATTRAKKTLTMIEE